MGAVVCGLFVVVVLTVLVGLDGYRVYGVVYTYGRYVTTTFRYDTDFLGDGLLSIGGFIYTY